MHNTIFYVKWLFHILTILLNRWYNRVHVKEAIKGTPFPKKKKKKIARQHGHAPPIFLPQKEKIGKPLSEQGSHDPPHKKKKNNFPRGRILRTLG